jgi:signal transduction histidine kinase
MPDRRRLYGRPPWWPEGERWQGSGSAWRGRLFPFVLIGLLVILGFGFLLGSAFHRPWLLWPLGVVAILVFARIGRPRYFPVGKLVDAAGKLAAGDYSVRVPEVEGGPMRQVVRSFNGMADRLEQSSEQRRRLLADLGHELRTPLTVIQGELEAMADGVHPVHPGQLEMLLDETHLLARLVDDLRVLSLSEAGELRLDKESVEARLLLEDAIAPYLPRSKRAGVEIRISADPGSITADPFRLREVLANLITNAIRHTTAGGAVDVKAGRTAAGWLISVRDTGAGIPATALPHIFDRFTKGGDSRGTGLGLSIARDLVRAHGGEITATSREGLGTTIEFTMPTQKI